jgi:hypothetical protein
VSSCQGLISDLCSKSSLADEQLKKMEMRRKKAVGSMVRIIVTRKTGFGNRLKIG